MRETKACPYCGEYIKKTAIKCKHCGSMLSGSICNPDNPETQLRLALAEKYEIMKLLGKGGMASVYKAVQKNLKRMVALKVVHQNLIHDDEFISRFHREAQAAASLNHPNIVIIFDEGILNGIHYIAMEYLEGKDLQDIIKNEGPLSIKALINNLAPISEALSYVHSKGLIHRDVKTANIFITKEGRPVLTDFGVAHAGIGTKLTQAGTVIGTPEYMSPEQAEGLEIDGRSDIFSMGVVLYEGLCAKLPFKGDNPLTTIHKIIHEDPPEIKTLSIKAPGWINQLLKKLLEKDKYNRIPDADIIAYCLRENKAPTVSLIKKYRKEIKTSEKEGSDFYKKDKKTNHNILITLMVIFAVIFTGSSILYFNNHNSNNRIDKELESNKNIADKTGGPFYQQSNLAESAEKEIQAGSYEKALILLNQALEEDSADANLKSKIKLVEKEISDRNRADEEKKLSESADQKLSEEKLYEAKRIYNEILQINPDNTNAKEKIAEINSIFSKRSDSKKQEEFNHYLGTADSLFIAKNYIRAVDFYKKALELKPGDGYLTDQLKSSNTFKSEHIKKLEIGRAHV